jgi:hypothetical protein
MPSLTLAVASPPAPPTLRDSAIPAGSHVERGHPVSCARAARSRSLPASWWLGFRGKIPDRSLFRSRSACEPVKENSREYRSGAGGAAATCWDFLRIAAPPNDWRGRAPSLCPAVRRRIRQKLCGWLELDPPARVLICNCLICCGASGQANIMPALEAAGVC